MNVCFAGGAGVGICVVGVIGLGLLVGLGTVVGGVGDGVGGIGVGCDGVGSAGTAGFAVVGCWWCRW